MRVNPIEIERSQLMTANKKELVKSLIKDFVTHMDTKRLQGIPLTKDEQSWISQKNGLSQYVYRQHEIPIYNVFYFY